MCCCDVTSCCCGCNSLQKGTFIWAIVDAIFNFIIFIGTAAPLGGASPTWICFGMVFWDILLAIGAHFRVTGCLIVWQVFMMIYIVLLFLMWIIIPVILVVSIFVASAAVADASKSGFTSTNTAAAAATAAASTPITAAAVISVLSLVFSIILPIIYIYFWIVVNNLRREFTRPAPQPPIATYPQPMYDY